MTGPTWLRRTGWRVPVVFFLAGICAALVLQFVLTVAFAPRPSPAPPTLRNPDVELRLSEPFLAEMARAALEQAETRLSFQELAVDVRPEQRLAVGGQAAVLFIDTPFHILLRPSIQAGALNLEVVEFSFGGFGLPAGLLRSLEDRLNQRIRAFATQPNAELLGVSTTEDALVVQLALDIQA